MVVIAVTVILLLLIAFYVCKPHIFEIKRRFDLMGKFEGPPESLLGCDLVCVSTPVQLLSKILDYCTTYDDPFKIRIGVRHAVGLKTAKSAESILTSTKHIVKSLEYKRFFSSWVGNGILTSDGNTWKTHRRIITPTFHFAILEEFISVFNACGNKLVEKLAKEVGSESFDLYPYITRCTLDIICESAMGVSIDAQTNPNSDFVKSVVIVSKTVIERALSVTKMFDFLYRFTNTYRQEQKALKILKDFTRNVIKSRKLELQETKSSSAKQEDEYGIRRKMAFLDMLILSEDASGPQLSDKEIEEEVNTFVFEGHDTTATSLCFTLYCLANHPEVQEKVVEELNAIFENDTARDCTLQDIQRMKYLELVIKESLRLYPSVPILGRELQEDAIIDGKIVPNGTTLYILLFFMHRDASIYPDPEKFIPERFLESNSRSPFDYIPFSAGLRNCIGQKFALMEMKATLSKLLRHYVFLPANPKHSLTLSAEVVLRSENGVRVQIKPRKSM